MSTDIIKERALTEEQLKELEDIFPPGKPPEKCRICGNRKIYKNDSVGPICKKCAYGWPDPVKIKPKVGRNTPCTCGSGKKYKECCGSVAGVACPPQ